MGTPRPATGNRADGHGAVKRELLVRYLDAWTPTVLRSAKRVTFAHGYAGSVGTGSESAAVAALRTFGEFTDRLSGKQLTMVLVEEDPDRLRALDEQLAAVYAELGSPAALTIHSGQGSCDERLVPALTEAGAGDGPLFACLDAPAGVAPAYDVVRAVARGVHREVLVTIDAAVLSGLADGRVPVEVGDRFFGGAGWRSVREQPEGRRYGQLVATYRQALRDAGLSLATHVELVPDTRVDDPDAAQLLVFATNAVKHLEKFKDELWAVDEYAGIRYRDPCDDEHTALAISLNPPLAPLRRALVAAVAARGVSTVADLRQHTLTETMYRVADVSHALPGLINTGTLVREPDKGRLTAETRLSPGN